MRIAFAGPARSALVAGGICLFSATTGAADESATTPRAKSAEAEVRTLGLLDAVRNGDVAASAEGIGDGRMTVSVTNRTKKALRVVLPPGLIASGATGQFGGMGGGGGGMGGGGMGGMGGGGMGGGGMGGGGMGGGMGGGVGGGGGMGGGGMGGGGMGGGGGGTMPASMGMMMLGRLIMQLVGDRDSWNFSSLMSGMMGGGMGGMGGGGMGGMGGGMGGMGGGMGGMRSVPPTGNPYANLEPGQTRNLPTRLVSLNAVGKDATIAFPAKGEKLGLGDEKGNLFTLPDGQEFKLDPRTRAALKRLAEDKAPTTISQLVLLNVAGGLDWSTIAEMSRGWANAYEISLARTLVGRLDTLAAGDPGSIQLQVVGTGEANAAAARSLTEALKGKTLLGLTAVAGVEDRPTGPALACKVTVTGKDATVVLATSNGTADAWTSAGKFTLPVSREKGEINAVAFADALTEAILDRLVKAQVTTAARVKGKLSYKLTIKNESPLLLNGLALLGKDSKDGELPKILFGMAIAPNRSMSVPASEEAVKELGLKKGVRLMAADLSGL